MARNSYDASHRPTASIAGDVFGVGLGAYGAFKAAADISSTLSKEQKGRLGEGLSIGKTIVQGDWPTGSQVFQRLDNGKATVIDHITRDGAKIEAKFGPRATLRPNQKYAQKQYAPNYRVDWWLPKPVGYGAAPFGAAQGVLNASGQWPTDADQDSN